MKYLYRKDKTVYFQVKVLMVNRITRSMLLAVKFQKSCNFSGNTNFERLLLDLLNIKPDCSYIYDF